MANTATNTAPATTPAKPRAKAAPAAKGKGKAPAKAKATPKGFGLRANPTAQGKRRTALNETAKVKVMVKANPKTAGTGAFNRFACYMALAASKGNGKFTVADVLNKGVQPSDLRYNITHGYIELA